MHFEERSRSAHSHTTLRFDYAADEHGVSAQRGLIIDPLRGFDGKMYHLVLAKIRAP